MQSINIIYLIFLKDLQRAFREKSALLSLLIIPLCLGLTSLIIPNKNLLSFSSDQDQHQIILPTYAPEGIPATLSAYLSHYNITIKLRAKPFHKPIEKAWLDFCLEVSSSPDGRWKFEISENSNSRLFGNSFYVYRIQQALNNYATSDEFIATAQIANKQNPTFTFTDTRFEEKALDNQLNTSYLPIFCLLLLIITASQAVIEITTKEQLGKTLESLLLAPVSLQQLFLGKIAQLTTISFIPVLVCIFSASMLSLCISTIYNTTPIISISFVFQLVFCLLPLAVLYASILVAMCIRERKYSASIGIASILILVMLFILGVTALWPCQDAYHYAIPIYGADSTIINLIAGKPVTTEALAYNNLGNVLAAYMLIDFISKKLITREELLYGKEH